MGAQMTKELGVYNEEEKICTPLGPQRYRLLGRDPRSPSLSIARTPIEVECTPPSLKTVQDDSVPITESSFIEDSGTRENIEINSSAQAEVENGSDLDREVKDISVEPRVKYLETDIDYPESLVSLTSRLSLNKENRVTLTLSDVRSPSLNVNRTPVLVECTPDLFALHSHIDSLSFCDFDIHSEDPSAVLSDDDDFSGRKGSSVKNWLDNVENKTCHDTPCSNFISGSPKTVARKQKELTALKKQLFFSPDIKETDRPKVRTPLGNLQASQLRESPQNIIRSKQWRNIQEERQRLGILDTENTPPNLPPISKVASAPGKIVNRRRNKINWDEDNTMLI